MATRKNIHYIHFDTIDSTNSWAKRNAHILDPAQLTCITAEEQTAGRGRWRRQWLSPRGQNIYASLFFCLPHGSTCVGNLGQVLALSCATILHERGFSPQIKWPNDILLANKKVAGILCETVPMDHFLGVILGIGINVNMTKELLETIDQPATSLAQLSGKPWQLEQILDPLLKQFLTDVETLQLQGFTPFYSTFERFLAHKGKLLSLSDGYSVQEGICAGIDEEGRLRLKRESGEITLISHGEITSTQ